MGGNSATAQRTGLNFRLSVITLASAPDGHALVLASRVPPVGRWRAHPRAVGELAAARIGAAQREVRRALAGGATDGAEREGLGRVALGEGRQRRLEGRVEDAEPEPLAHLRWYSIQG